MVIIKPVRITWNRLRVNFKMSSYRAFVSQHIHAAPGRTWPEKMKSVAAAWRRQKGGAGRRQVMRKGKGKHGEGFFSDFADGFKKGFNGVLNIGKPLLGLHPGAAKVLPFLDAIQGAVGKGVGRKRRGKGLYASSAGRGLYASSAGR